MDAAVTDAPPNPPLALRYLPWLRAAAMMYLLALATGTHWPRLELNPLDPSWRDILQFDKVLHVLGFGGLTLAIALARPAGRRASWGAQALTAGILAGLYAILDEWSQGWFAVERTVAVQDAMASLGGVMGVFIMMATPGRAERGGRWSTIGTWAVRVFSVALLPVLVWLALAPEANRWMAQLIRTYQLGRHLDYGLHFYLSMLVLALLVLVRPAGRRRPRAGAFLALGLSAISPPIIELVQTQTGRGAVEVLDMYYHLLGLLTGMGIWTLLVVGRILAGEPEVQAAAETTAAGAAAPPAADSNHFVGHALLVSGLTLVSRATGLVRDAVLAAALGLTWVADAFFIGFLVPNLFRRLFGEGALTASFIPQYTQLVRDDPQLARRFASIVFVALAVGLAILTLIGEAVLASGVLVGDDPSRATSLALWLTMVMLPYMPLVCLTALLGGALQVHGRFGAPAAAPVVLNLVIIATALMSWMALPIWRAELPIKLATYVAVSVLVAGVIQLAWQIMALRRCTAFTWDFTGTRPSLLAMGRMLGPMVFGLAVFQINSFLDTLIAFGLSSREGETTITMLGRTFEAPIQTGAVAALAWAQRLYQFPLGVFAIAIATAIYPALARASGDMAEFRTILQRGLRLTVFIALPAGVGLILLREPISRVIYERFNFTQADALRVAAILMGYSSSIWAYAMTQVLTRAFYARQDAKTPLRVGMAMVALNLALNLTLIWPLGAAGLAWSTAISAALQTVVLLVLVQRHAGPLLDRTLLGAWGRIAVLAGVMALVLGPVLSWTYAPSVSPWTLAALLAGWVALGGLAYLGGAVLTGSAELRWLVRRQV